MLTSGPAGAGQGIDLVEEDGGGGVEPGHLEQNSDLWNIGWRISKHMIKHRFGVCATNTTSYHIPHK